MGRWSPSGPAVRRWWERLVTRLASAGSRLRRSGSRLRRSGARLRQSLARLRGSQGQFPGSWSRREATTPQPGLVGALVALPVLAVTVARGVAGGPAMVSGDPTYFALSGWASAHGDVVYRHTWDVKPPGVHLVTWAAAAVGGSPAGYYVLLLAVTAAVTLAVFVLADGLLWSLDAGTAGRAAGALALVAYPPLYRLPVRGAYTKVFVLAFALGTLLALRRDRPLAAGAAAAAAAAFWQAGAVVAAVGLVAVARRGDRRDTGRFVGGGVAVAVVVVAPVVLAGATWSMVTQVVAAPLLNSGTFLPVLDPPSELYGLAPPLLGAALAGLGMLAVGGEGGELRGTDGRTDRAYAAVAAGYLLVALAAQASIYDRVLYAGLLAVPVGVAVAGLPRRTRVVGVVVVAAVVVQSGALAPLLAAPSVEGSDRSELERVLTTDRDTPCHVYRSRYARAVETRYPSLVRRGDDCAAPAPGKVLGVLADVVTGSVPDPDGDWSGGPDPIPSGSVTVS